MVLSKKITLLLFFVLFMSNNIRSADLAQSSSLSIQPQKNSKKNSHRPPPLSPPNKDKKQTENAKEFFSSAPRSRPNSARQKKESPNEDSSPVTLSKIFQKLCAIEKEIKDIKNNQKKLLKQQTHTQTCVSALIHLQEAAAIKPKKKLHRNNRVHPSPQPSGNTQTLSIHIIPERSPVESISDSSPLE